MTLPMFEGSAEELSSEQAGVARRAARAGTFVDNMKLPVHRWFRYSAGFSADWVTEVIKTELPEGGTLLDPFAGSGTSLLAADRAGVVSVGYESHPFVSRVSQAKLAWDADADKVWNLGRRVSGYLSSGLDPLSGMEVPELLSKCYTPSALHDLRLLRAGWEQETGLASTSAREEHSEALLVWLAITAILRPCSGVGTAQWQYVLPNKQKSKVASPRDAFDAKLNEIVADLRYAQTEGWAKQSKTFAHDARNPLIPIEAGSVDLVVTSPPYANNYDYADATRLEMTFWGHIRGWGDLNSAVRTNIVRSCTQHAAADKVTLEELLGRDELSAIAAEIVPVCNELADVRLQKGGKKNYHTMVAAYFFDMSKVFVGLRTACRPGARVYFVVGDSAPYGVYVPVEQWLGKLALQAGFKSFSFQKIRDRNTKWKNRKHTVPLHEGYLIIEG